jgi:hypothetical protein
MQPSSALIVRILQTDGAPSTGFKVGLFRWAGENASPTFPSAAITNEVIFGISFYPFFDVHKINPS